MQMLNQYSIAAAACEVLPQYDVKEAYLFGSYARNEADGNSDVDLCVECGKSFTLFPSAGLESLWKRRLGDLSM